MPTSYDDDFFFADLEETYSATSELTERYDRARKAIYSQMFPKQQQVVDDPYRMKSLLTPRRCGKTHCAISYALIVALEKPHANVVIVTLTLGSAKKLYWHPILKFNDDYELGLRRKGGIDNTKGIATFENGSRIYLVGCQTRQEIEKLRGGAYDLVIIDECKSFYPHILTELIEEILEPALMDRRGTLVLIGTPGNVLMGPFYEATCPTFKKKDRPIIRVYDDPQPFWTEDVKRSRFPEWSFHTFNQSHNIYCPHLWEDALQKKYIKGWKDDNPVWLREYLGQWIASGDEMVYDLASLINEDGGVPNCRVFYEPGEGQGFNKWGLPEEEHWHYVLGIDMGFEDDTAIVVVAYSESTYSMKLVYEFKKAHMLPFEIADQINQIRHLFDYQIDNFIADTGNLGKAIVEEMNALNDFYLQPAEKTQKYDFIQLLNSDMHTGQIQVPFGSELADEWLQLNWDLKNSTKRQMAKAGRLQEDKSQDNHLSDAFLYTWRFCYHHWARPENAPNKVNETRALIAWDRAQAKKAAAKRDKPLDNWYDNEPLLQEDNFELPFGGDFDTSWLL